MFELTFISYVYVKIHFIMIFMIYHIFLIIIILLYIFYYYTYYQTFHSFKKLHSDGDMLYKCFVKEKRYYKCKKRRKEKLYNKNITHKDRYNPLSYYYIYKFPIINKNVSILVYNICLCEEFDEREAVRMTWGVKTNKLYTLYVIGNTNKKCEKQLNLESKLNKDILRINIDENYYNQTLFTIYLLKLLPIVFENIQFFIKSNLDDLVNWKLFFKEYNRVFYIKDLFIVPNIGFMKEVPYDNNYKYSSSKDIADYYNKHIPKEGIKTFDGFFYGYSRELSLLLFNESIKFPKLINAEDQYISWLLYSIGYSNFKKIKSLEKPHDNIINNKKYSVIHRIKGPDLLALFKYLYN